MSLTLSAVDNTLKSVTFTVAGSTGTATIKGARWHGKDGPMVWDTLGTIAAPGGTLTVTVVAFGLWMFTASDSTTFANPFFLSVVDIDDAVMNQAEDGVAEQIKRMNLPTIGNRVYTQLVPDDTVAQYPCVFVVGNEGVENADGSNLNATESIGYPVRVLICTRDALTHRDLRKRLGKWRQMVRRAFSSQRLPGVSKIIMTKVEPGPRLQQYTYPGNTGSNGYQMVATILTVRCISREPRGIGS